MRAMLLAGLISGLVAAPENGIQARGQEPKVAPKEEPKPTAKETPAAGVTRAKPLKAKVTVDFTDARLGDILKELAHLAEEQTEQPLSWAYGEKFPFAQKMTFAVKGQPLETALDELLKKAGGGLGYVVVSKEGDKYDGWVRLTTTGERGFETPPPPPASEEDEATAKARLTLAKKLVDSGKGAAAKPLLELILKKYPTTKAAPEAKELLDKIEKE